MLFCVDTRNRVRVTSPFGDFDGGRSRQRNGDALQVEVIGCMEKNRFSNSYPPKEIAVGAIQRDRLERFLQESLKQRSGCFYYALFMAYNAFYPNAILDRNIAGKIMSLNNGDLGVTPGEVVQRVEELKEELKISVSKIGITPYEPIRPEEFRKEFEIPSHIDIFKMETSKISDDPEEKIIVFWGSDDGRAHFTAMDSGQRFLGEEREGGNMGGQEGVDFSREHGLRADFIFYLKKTIQNK